MPRSWRLHVGVLIAYAAVAIAFSWPLALHLGTRVTGGTGGDTGVYVWNQWVFHHELVENRSFPYFTHVLFGPDHRTDLSLHNYTTFQDLVAAPFASVFSVVETFNIVYLLMVVLTAYSTFLLARHVTRGVPESFLAGLLFAWSPVLVTRGMGHFSLVAAAPLAIFLLILMRADSHVRLRDALALGLTMAWAATTDVYYAIFCLLIGAVFLVARVVSIEPNRHARRERSAVRGLNVAILCLAGLVVAIAVTGGWELTLAGQTVRIAQSLHARAGADGPHPHSTGAAVPPVTGGTDHKRRPALRRLDGRDGCRRCRFRRAHSLRGGSPHRSG